ncbi:MAG: hypothetical protein Q7N50_00405 [Armatimonadota bacterium]|nr:hypothetical protein [Armatimonadota bacterium]
MKIFRSLAPLALIVLALVLVTAVSGCHDKRTDISRILQNPDKYMGDEVIVAGEVVKVYSAQLIIAEPGLYQVDDGTGTIWVVTKNGVPREGVKIGLKGIVSSPIKIAGESFGAVIRESERRYK